MCGEFAGPRGERRLSGGVLDPLRACVAVAAGIELGLATERGASSGVVHGAALAASVGRPTWRVPLISCLVATRILELVRLAGSPRRRSLRQTSRPLAAVALWALALLVLGRESARAEAWEAPRSP